MKLTDNKSRQSSLIPRFVGGCVLLYALIGLSPVLLTEPADFLLDTLGVEQGSDLLAFGRAHAQSSGRDKSKEKGKGKGKGGKKKIDPRFIRKTPAMRNKIFEKLQEANTFVEEKKYEEAFVVLQELLDKEGKRELNSYEKAQVYNTYAFSYYSLEKYEKAVENYEKLLKQAEIPIAMEVATKYTIAQLYFVLEKYPLAVKALEDWFVLAENPAPDSYVLLCQGYIQTKQLDLALINCMLGVSVAEVKGRKLKEQWFVLLRYLYNEKNNVPKQLEMLEILLATWPKKEYWLGASAMYGELNRDKDQMHALETAYVQGLLNREGELVMLAQMFASNEMPYKAAKVMDKGIKAKQIKPESRNLERLGEYWRLAQETKLALPELLAAAETAETGEPFVRLAYIYSSLDMHKQAAKAVRQGLKQGGVKRPTNAKMLLAQSLFHAKDYKDSAKMFKGILKDESKKNARNRKQANQWLRYMEREIRRQEEISKYLTSN